MKNISILFLLTLVLGLTSCHKFLEEKSQDQLTPTTATDFLQLLYGQGYPAYNATSAMQKGLVFMDDDVQMNNFFKGTITNTPGNQNNVAALLSMYSWQPNAYDQLEAAGQTGLMANFNAWQQYYALIMIANTALDNADVCSGSDADKNYLKGQAYGLRAYYYFMLVNFYGAPYNAAGVDPATSPGVPLILTAKVENSTLYQKRNSVQEVYSRITADLDTAITCLEKSKTFNAYRMNYLAAHLLASRVYLYMENWNKVIEHANAVTAVKAGLMNLSNPISQSATSNYNAILGATNIETLWTFGSLNDYSALYGGSQIYRLSDGLLRSYASNDLRIKNTFIISNLTLSQYAYTMQTNKQYVGGNTTMKAFRVAEAYLNRAEAYLHLAANGDANGFTNAMADLNTIRNARYVNPVAWSSANITAVSALDSCKGERRKELFLEDHRWFDLRRYGMPAITHVYYNSATDSVKYTLAAGDKQYIWAIPQDVLDRNYMLIQNPLSGVRITSSY